MRGPTQATAFVGLVGLVAALSVAVPGCERVTTELEDRAGRVVGNVAEELSRPQDETVEDSPPLTADQRLVRKLSLYVECRGRASPRIHQSWERYDERINAKGTLRKKATTPMVYTIDTELRPCEHAATQGPRVAPPLLPIEHALDNYFAHAETFAVLSAELDDYFEDEGYTQDGWARGKELGPQFAAAYEAWSTEDAILQRLVEKEQDEVDRRILDEAEQREGKTLPWHARNVVLHARAFMRCVRPAEATGKGCKDDHDALAEADRDFDKSVEDNPAIAKGAFWMSAFRGSVETFVTRASEATTAPRKGPPKHPLSPPLSRAYDSLISDSNNLRFER